MATAPSLPGTTGTPQLRIVLFANALSPILLIISGEGPINLIFVSAQISENSAFSAKNP